MFSLKCLTKKFNKQTLNEVKPAPLSETVDHTLPNYLKPAFPLAAAITITPSASSPASEFTDRTPPNDHTLTGDRLFTDHNINNPSGSNSSSEDEDDPPARFPSSPNIAAATSPTSTFSSSSDSEDTEEEEEEEEEEGEGSSLPLRTRVRSPRKTRLSPELRMQRIYSAEKRKYSQYKCSTGGSSPSSSDDEIKEAFESTACRLHKHSPPTHFSWTHSTTAPHFSSPFLPTTCTTATSFTSSPNQPLSAWNIEPARRPHKVVPPIGRHKHKFFAQMPSSFMDRPFLDFNKMQHSKRLVMVRRPMVIRNNSRVHSIHRPSPPSLQVPLDISQHSFQPVLMQT